MKPRDIIRHTNSQGHERFWEISAVMLGGTGQESNVELEPVTEHPGSEQHPTRCPVSLLEAAIRSGEAKIYSC